MPYSYKGSINFGFVYIPIILNIAANENKIPFNLLDRKTNSKIRYKKTCEECDNKEVDNDDIIKGYEYEPGKFVTFEDSDFEKIKSKKDKNIVIESFVPLDEIDPIYFKKTYYVIPKGAYKAYNLLVEAMKEEKKAGLAKSVIGNKESLIVIRESNGRMLLNTLYFYNEIIENHIPINDEKININELNLAKKLIKQMSSKFEPKKYNDEYNIKLQKAIENKISGKEIVSIEENNTNEIIDLMDALKQSIEDKTKKNTIVTKKNRSRSSANA